MTKPDTGREQPEPNARPRRRFLTGVLTGGLLGSLLVGGVGMYSYANQNPGWWSRAGRGMCGLHRHGPHGLAAAGERAEHAADWMLRHIDASEAQRDQVKALVRDAMADLGQLKEQHAQNRQAFLDALAQPNIDRDALGDLRRAELELAETASGQLVDVIADVADILTPEQRTQLIDYVERFHH